MYTVITMNCKVTPLFEVLSKKWNLHILKHLQDNGSKRFNELLEEIKGINPRILSSRLKELEDLKIISKERFKEIPPRCEYSLTSSGVDLVDCFSKLDVWLDKHKPFI